MTARTISLAALGAALTAVSAQLSVTIPLLTGVPFTLQVFAVLLVGAVLGARVGTMALLLYLLLGLAGLPVFARLRAGPAVLFGPTGGYLWAFPVAAYLVGWAAEGAASRAQFLARTGAAMVVALGVIYGLGVAGLVISGAAPTVAHAVQIGVIPFAWLDLLKAALALGLSDRIRAALRRPELVG